MEIFRRISLLILKGVIYPCKVGCCVFVVCLAVSFALVRITTVKGDDVRKQIRLLVIESHVLAYAVALCYFLRVDTLACDEDQGNQDHKLHLADKNWSEIEADHPLINANFWKIQVQGSAKRLREYRLLNPSGRRKRIDASQGPTFSQTVQWSAKRWALGCMNPAFWLPLAAGREFTQPRAHLLVDPCT